MGGGHDGHGGGVKGFVSNLVGGGKGHGHGHGQGYDHGYGQQQQHGYGGHGAYYPPPAAGYGGGYPAHGYAPAAYPAQPAPHHGT